MIRKDTVIRKDTKHANEAEALNYEGREEVQKGKDTKVKQNVDNMEVDKPSPVTGVNSKKSRRLVTADEPIFADTTGGRKARKYYFLSKMGLGNTFDQEDIDRYYAKNMVTDSRQSPPTATIQTEFNQMKNIDIANHQDYGYFGRRCSDNYVNDGLIREVTNDKIRKVMFDMYLLKALVVDDASLRKEGKMTSIGVTAMDSCGNLLQAFGNPIQFVRKTITAEALAIHESLENAKGNGWLEVQICLMLKVWWI
ncbi:hypothetical protein HAX54_034607 [Datura stramonium]|uniref:RNase H type-1 domain-containing protein n=1 Tax=Datura stramonium TaxID=4076 RepID=A0ABS8VFQ2_DATST|nr:hypothetical protein [Datura stramonium]